MIKIYPSEHAAIEIQSAIDAGERKILLANGTYSLALPLRIGEDASGLVISAETDGGAILTSAIPLVNLEWRPWNGHPGVFVADGVPFEQRIDRLFADGVALSPARFPTAVPGKLPLDGVAGADDVRARSERWSNPSTGFMRALHNLGWGGNSYAIEGRDIESPTGLKLRWIGDNNRGSGFDPSSIVIENILDELDSPGEFFHDVEGRRLYVFPRNGRDGLKQLSASMCDCLIDIRGSSHLNPASRIELRGLVFAHTARSLFSGRAYEPLLRGDWCVQRIGVVRMADTVDCVVDGCTFHDIGGNAIFIDEYAERDRVSNCTLCGMGASGIQICGAHSAVREPSYWENNLGLPVHRTVVEHPELTGPADENYPRDLTIENCEISEIGLVEKQSSGINVSVAARISIMRCSIHGSARSCININDGTFGGHEIAFCRLYDAQRETLDHGPFNSWGRDRYWSVPRFSAMGENGECIRRYRAKDGNWHDLSAIDCVERNRFHHNLVMHDPMKGHSWGIDLDDGSSRYDICDNYVVGCGIKLREGFDRLVEGNTVIDGSIEIHVPFAEARDIIRNNTIASSRPFGFACCDCNRLRASCDIIEGNSAQLSLPGFSS